MFTLPAWWVLTGGYYEAAEIEGADPLAENPPHHPPLIRPTIITMVMLSVGKIFYSDFGMFYQVPMNSGAVLSTTNVIDTYVYRGLLQQGNIGCPRLPDCISLLWALRSCSSPMGIVRRVDRENAFF